MKKVKRIIRHCKICKKRLELLPCRVKNGWGLYCSRKCSMLFKNPKYWLGKKMSEEQKKKMSDSHKASFKNGRKQWNDGLRGWNMGEKNPQWKGGVTSKNTRIRQSADYKLWRKSVFERDDYTCVWCGVRGKAGARAVINADHIKPFAHHPDLRFDINNGRTLCVPCHKTTDTYGKKI